MPWLRNGKRDLTKIFNHIVIYKSVFKKIKNILKSAGVSPANNILVQQIKGEDSNLVFHIDNDNNTYALKVFLNTNNDCQFYTNKKFNQLAKKAGLATPPIIYLSNDCKVLPAPWILWQWVNGRLLCDLNSQSRRFDAAVQVGMHLRKMHEIKIFRFGYPKSQNEWSGDNIKWTINFFIKRIKRLIKNGGNAFPANELTKIFRATLENNELLLFKEPCLLHGDITGGNIIVGESGDITLIDPGEIIAGDPMSDLGYSQTTRLSPIFRRGVWQGYTHKNPLTKWEYNRFISWRLLRQGVIACRAFLNQDKNAQKYIEDTLSFLEEFEK